MTTKLPPHNIEAEQAVLGAILLNNTFYSAVSGALSAADFYEPLHARIMHQAGELISRGQVANPITLKDLFADIQIGEGMSVQKYLAALSSAGVLSRIELDGLVKRIRDLAKMRGLIDVAKMLGSASDDGSLPEAALESAWDTIDAIRAPDMSSGQRGSIASMASILMEADSASVTTTGLADLDRAIAGGWRAGRLYIVAGRPGMGKTVLGVSSSRRVARKGFGVSIFSLEIDTREILARIAADELSHSSFPIAYRDIVAGTLDKDSYKRVCDVVDRISKLPIRIDATGGISITEIEARARSDREAFAKAGQQLGVVVIDYLGLIRASDRYRGNKVHELGEIALAGKTMAKRLDCAVVMLAQLNRSVESRDDKRPTMSDLRDSGNIEEHADFVGLLYRPSYYLERSAAFREQDPEAMERVINSKNDLELIIGKNRLGSTEVVKLWCNPALSAVDNMQRFG